MTLFSINIIFSALFIGGAFYLWRRANNIRKDFTTQAPFVATNDNTLISISVPKNNDRTPLAAEQLFAALHGIFRNGADAQPQISCEIVSKNKHIVFYLYVPTALKEFVLSQVYAQYPTVDVQEIPAGEDYAVVDELKYIAATELALKRPTVYPIKTFQNFEVDPISSITGVLSSVGAGEEAWIQTIIRPIDDTWQDKGDSEIKAIKDPPKKVTHTAEFLKKEIQALGKEFMYSVLGSRPAEKKEEKKDEKKELPGPVQQAVKGIEEKITKLGFEVVIRLVSASTDQFAAQAKLEQLIGAYKQYNSINLNSFVSKEISTDKAALDLYRSRAVGTAEMIFNVTELASIYHFPSETVTTPTIAWAGAKKGEPPANLPVVGSVPAEELTVFAQTNFRNNVSKFGIKRNDRRLHTYIIGKTGTGKSTLMENMIFDDIREGRGVAVVDPHGELIDHVLEFIPEERLDDVVYFSPADYDFPVGFNVLEQVDANMRNVVASGVVGIFKKIFGESWGPRLEYILRNAILALLEYPNATLLGVMRILNDNAYRRSVLSQITDPVIRDFFVNEYEKYEPKFRQEAIAPIQNKVGQFTSSSTIRNIIGQPKTKMDIRKIMDEGKILLADLSTGKIGEDNSALLGSMLITKIQLAAMGRTNIVEADRRDFYLYVDEFQNFATDSFATILSEARKYRLNLVMINQYISQMPETVANAVFGNVGTMIAFRVGASDAKVMIKEFEPVFDENDLVNQPNRHIYIKMAIDGVTVPAFSAGTLPPPPEKSMLREQAIAASRQKYAMARSDVEEYIADWSSPMDLSAEWKKEGSETEKGGVVRTESPNGIVTFSKPKPAEQQTSLKTEPAVAKAGESDQVSKPVESTEQGSRVAQDVLERNKIQILNDRFSRKWYAVSPKKTEAKDEVAQAEQQQIKPEVTAPVSLDPGVLNKLVWEDPTEKTADTPGQSGGGAGESEPLITWESASDLGPVVTKTEPRPQVETTNSDDFLPIDEL